MVSKQKSEKNGLLFTSDEDSETSLKELHKKNKKVNDSIRNFDLKLASILEEKFYR